MNDNFIFTESQSGLSAFFTKIYSLVGIGIGLSAFVSWLMLYPFQQNLLTIMTQYPWVYMGAFFIELALVFLASNAARKNTAAALPLFLTYSALNGFT
ncbi:Bax inhibitor-1 family protein, partial [Streptococcus pluranimalium]